MQIPVDMNREAVTTETTVQLTCSHLECLLFVSIHTRNSKYYIQMRKMNSGCYGYQGFYFLSVQDANTGHHCIRILQILSRTVWINSCLTYQGLLSVVFFLEIFRNPLRFHHVQEAPFWQLEPFWKTQLDKVHIFTHTHTLLRDESACLNLRQLPKWTAFPKTQQGEITTIAKKLLTQLLQTSQSSPQCSLGLSLPGGLLNITPG